MAKVAAFTQKSPCHIGCSGCWCCCCRVKMMSKLSFFTTLLFGSALIHFKRYLKYLHVGEWTLISNRFFSLLITLVNSLSQCCLKPKFFWLLLGWSDFWDNSMRTETSTKEYFRLLCRTSVRHCSIQNRYVNLRLHGGRWLDLKAEMGLANIWSWNRKEWANI